MVHRTALLFSSCFLRLGMIRCADGHGALRCACHLARPAGRKQSGPVHHSIRCAVGTLGSPARAGSARRAARAARRAVAISPWGWGWAQPGGWGQRALCSDTRRHGATAAPKRWSKDGQKIVKRWSKDGQRWSRRHGATRCLSLSGARAHRLFARRPRSGRPGPSVRVAVRGVRHGSRLGEAISGPGLP
jgi:hypothetical protein